MSETRILVVEDETHLAQGLLFNLRAEGYHVELAGDGEQAIELLNQALLNQEPFDAVLLDVMLPGKSGFEIAAELRRDQNYVPLLMLTARGRPEDVLQGFSAGADDYLAKPFDLSILLARLNGLMRRMKWHTVNSKGKGAEEDLSSFEFAGRRIDFENLRLEAMGKEIHLTLMEADLLRYLVRNQGRSISRKELLEQVWRLREDTDTRAIDNFIVRLRRYIEDEPSEPHFLRTVRGIGYSFLPGGE